MVTYGTRAEVWSGVADRTRGGLTKDGLMINARGKLVSRKRSELARKMNTDRLREYQYKKKDGKSVARTRQTVSKKASKAVVQSGPETGKK